MINSLSVVFPLYNESKRLHYTLKDIKSFNRGKIKKLEFIFIDDGSTDNSVETLKKNLKKLKKKNFLFRIISFKKNMGKGNAIKEGVKLSKYNWILTIDTDMSVSLTQINEWIKKNHLTKKHSIYFGSRNLKNSIVKFKIHRKVFGIIFSTILKIFFQIYIKDTQCGFKLYKKNKAKFIFPKIKDPGFVHDVEILLISKKHKISVKELPVRWTHRKNSKLNLFYDCLIMLVGLIKIRINFLIS